MRLTEDTITLRCDQEWVSNRNDDVSYRVTLTCYSDKKSGLSNTYPRLTVSIKNNRTGTLESYSLTNTQGTAVHKTVPVADLDEALSVLDSFTDGSGSSLAHHIRAVW